MLIKPTWPRIRKQEIRGVPYWIVDRRPIAKKLYCTSENAAKTLAHQERIERNNGREPIEARLALQATEAMKLLEPHGIGLIRAAELAIQQIQFNHKLAASPPMWEALDSWKKVKERELKRKEIRKPTWREIKRMAKIFREAWGQRKVMSLTSREVSEWMDGLDHSRQTRLNLRTKLSQFFNWCKARELVEGNPCDLVQIGAGVSRDITVLSVERCKKLLKSAKGTLVEPYVLIGLFTGMRPGEILGLDWSDIEPGQIRVRAETSKVKETRFIPISRRLYSRLKKPQAAGRLFPSFMAFRTDWRKVLTKAGYSKADPWPKDALRHSFASYWLPMHNDRPRLAEIMGNSVNVIRKFYRKAIPLKEAKEFWKLLSEQLRR